ncbi:MAG: sarcosine oxidase subunit beta family protein [Chromatiales bacterium]|jgi:sarcosine oxidase, subunit beta|nr:sarcosine oxidase subunit beta family protein [Chromatiales bacterium]
MTAANPSPSVGKPSKYSIFALARNALGYHQNWSKLWRSPDPKPHYDVIIIGGGGHGLGAAYFLAKEHGIRNIAVLEKGWLGGGNTARNTMTIRSNYVRPPSVPFHEESMALYRQLSRELNYNLMVTKRGMVVFLQSSATARTAARMANTMHVYGAEYEFLTLDQIKRKIPIFEYPEKPRMEVFGGVHQPSAMMARHDAVAWGFARMADAYGVDIIQNCEVLGIIRDGERVTGVNTTRGVIKAPQVGMAVAGHGSVVAEMAGVRLPIETQPLQAWVSEPLKPVLDPVLLFSGYGVYMMQSDKGELVIGGPTDPYPSYAQRGAFPIIEQVTTVVTEMFPIFKRVKLMRHWAGMLDIVYDGSPIISNTHVKGFTVDVAGAGGFKTTPMAARMHAWLIAKGEPHPRIEKLGLDRFETGRLVVEGGVSFNR